MQVTGKIWIFYNSETEKQTKPLSVVQAQMTLLTFKNRELKSIFIWTPGWPEWKSLTDFLKSNQTVFVATQPPRPKEHNEKDLSEATVPDYESQKPHPPHAENIDPDTGGYTKIIPDTNPQPSKEDYGYYFNDFNGHELDLSKIKKIKPLKSDMPVEEAHSRRSGVRHNFKLEVILVNRKRTFRTYSKNISLGGTLLEDEIPKDFLNQPFDLFIINKFEADPKKGRLLFKAKIIGDFTNPRRLMFLDADPQMIAKLNVLLQAYLVYQDQMKKQVG